MENKKIFKLSSVRKKLLNAHRMDSLKSIAVAEGPGVISSKDDVYVTVQWLTNRISEPALKLIINN